MARPPHVVARGGQRTQAGRGRHARAPRRALVRGRPGARAGPTSSRSPPCARASGRAGRLTGQIVYRASDAHASRAAAAARPDRGGGGARQRQPDPDPRRGAPRRRRDARHPAAARAELAAPRAERARQRRQQGRLGLRRHSLDPGRGSSTRSRPTRQGWPCGSGTTRPRRYMLETGTYADAQLPHRPRPAAVPGRSGHPVRARRVPRGVRVALHQSASGVASGDRRGGQRRTSREAEGLFRRAIKENPEFVEARVHHGFVLGRSRRATKTPPRNCGWPPGGAGPAAPLLRRAVPRPGGGVARQSRAARDDYARAAALYPAAQSPLLALSCWPAQLGDRAGAQDAMRQLLALPAGDEASETDPWWVYYSLADRGRRGAASAELLASRVALGGARGERAGGRLRGARGWRGDARGARRRTRRSRRGSRPCAWTCSSPRTGNRCAASARPTSRSSTTACASTVDLVSFEQLPLNVVFTFDMSDSVVGERLANLREAGRAVLDGLKKGDQAALVTFNSVGAARRRPDGRHGAA